MHLPINRTTLLYSAAGTLAATAITASFLARLYLLRRRAALQHLPPAASDGNSGVPGEPSVVEELVSHNWKGF
jgi:hypothetical protein